MQISFSFDDGSQQDFRTQELLRKYGFAEQTIFYIPSKSELTWDGIRELAEYSEIGGHTVHHPMDMKLLTDENMAAEIKINKYELEVVTGKPVLSFCYPRGRFDENVKKAVMDAGYIEARTTRVMQTFASGDAYEKDTTIHMNPRDEYNGKHWLEVAKDMLGLTGGAGVIDYFHVWGHSWEIEKNNDWHHFETLLELLSDKEQIWNQQQ